MEFETIKKLGGYCQRVDNQLRNVDSTAEREKMSVKRATALPTSSLKTPQVAAYMSPMKEGIID